MFTGIVQEIGQVVDKTSLLEGINITVKCSHGFLDQVSIGDSIAIEGACMTVVSLSQDTFSVDVSKHSLSIINDYELNQFVNLEKALKENSFLGGHVVSGHVDSTALLYSFDRVGESYKLVLKVDNKKNPKNLGQFMAQKGSITINGVSLTINTVLDESQFTYITCNLIPHTIRNTTFQYFKANAIVNIEIDLFARYMQRIIEFRQNSL